MKKKKKSSPFLIILLSFVIIIFLGTICFMLPFASTGDNLTFVEALFTSTSAVCVTGLSVIPNIGETLTLFGKIVLATLIEIGGLGLITLTLFVITILGIKISIRNKFLLREALNQDSTVGISGILKAIVLITFSIQIVGTIINFFILKYSVGFDGLGYTDIQILGYSAFHTISSFNNAGFDLFGASSLTDTMFSTNVLFNLNTMVLIILGGLGFIVILDLLSFKRWKNLQLHTKIVLITTLFLIIIGTLLLWGLTDMNFLQALFQSVSARTAGFATKDLSEIRGTPGFIIHIILMFVGASPCSVGGGIKTTTLFVLIISMFSYATGKKPIVFNRRIASASVIKAFTLVVLALSFIFTMSIIVSTIELNFGILQNKSHGLDEIIFEVFSAFGTVGNSTGITCELTVPSQLILCIVMFTGRLGPLTIMNLWNRHWLVDNTSDVKYVKKSIIIG
ncbi:MAG: TrkH family potassium uptake protein [Bacilli bacterium]